MLSLPSVMPSLARILISAGVRLRLCAAIIRDSDGK
jgi:hypothetical protein